MKAIVALVAIVSAIGGYLTLTKDLAPEPDIGAVASEIGAIADEAGVDLPDDGAVPVAVALGEAIPDTLNLTTPGDLGRMLATAATEFGGTVRDDYDAEKAGKQLVAALEVVRAYRAGGLSIGAASVPFLLSLLCILWFLGKSTKTTTAKVSGAAIAFVMLLAGCGGSGVEVRARFDEPTQRLVSTAFRSGPAFLELAGREREAAVVRACAPAADAARRMGFLDYSDGAAVTAATGVLSTAVRACVVDALTTFGSNAAAQGVAACGGVLDEGLRAAVTVGYAARTGAPVELDLPKIKGAGEACLVGSLEAAGEDRAALVVEAVYPIVETVIDLVLLGVGVNAPPVPSRVGLVS